MVDRGVGASPPTILAVAMIPDLGFHCLGLVAVSHQSIGSLTGFSIPCQLVCCFWNRSRHGLNRCQWIGHLRRTQMIHGGFFVRMEAPPCGTFCVDFALHLTLELDSDKVDMHTADPLASDKLGQQ